MLANRTLLTASNLNNAYISQTNTNPQAINSSLTISGGALTLKNSSITDNASPSYLRISPQGNNLILYDGVHNQQLSVYSSSGSESTYLTTINGTKSIGILDVSSAIDHLEIATNSSKPVIFGGTVSSYSTISGSRLVANAPNTHLQFQESGNNKWHFESVNGILNFVETGVATRATLSPSTGNLTLSTGMLTAQAGVQIKGTNQLSFSDYGGGFNMTDTTWIRTTGSKSFYHNSGEFRTDGTLEVGGSGATLSVPNGGAFNYMSGKFTISTGGVVYASSPVGIGTTAPTSMFQVNESAMSMYTISDHVYLQKIGGSQYPYIGFVDSGGTRGGYIGWGTTGSHLDFALENNNNLYINLANGTNKVGIGTANPSQTVDVVGNIQNNGTFISNSTSADVFQAMGASGTKTFRWEGGNLRFYTSQNGVLEAMTLANNGNIGINQVGPSYKLDVTGDIRTTTAFRATTNNAQSLYVGSNSAIWDVNTANTMGVYGQQNSAVGALKLGSTGPTLYGTGNSLGLGTTTPSSSFILDTVGNIRIGGGNGIYSAYNNGYILNDHNNGNVTLSATGSHLYLGYQNTASVYLSSLLQNTSGVNILGTDGTLYYKGTDISTLYAPSGYGLGTVGHRQVSGSAMSSVSNGGWYDIQNPTDGIAGQTWHSFVHNPSADTNYATQFAFPMTDNTSNPMYVRNKTSGTWGSWKKVWTQANMGNGSGLDADTVRTLAPASTNTASTIVSRDTSGNFSAGTITATLVGNASSSSSATKLTTARNISYSGDMTGSTSFDGSSDVTIPMTLANTGVTAGSYNYVTVDAKGRVTGASYMGYQTSNQTISITGDANGSGTTSIPITLASSGVTAGTYTRVSVDTKGRVTTGSSLAYSDVTNALGYTPLNQNGGNLYGTLYSQYIYTNQNGSYGSIYGGYIMANGNLDTSGIHHSDYHETYSNGYLYLRPPSGYEVRVMVAGSTSTYNDIRANNFAAQNNMYVKGVAVQTSSATLKDKITPYTDDAIDLLKSVNIYRYHLIQNLENRIYDNEMLGALTEGLPPILKGDIGNTVNPYAMVSALWRASQQQQDLIEKLENEIKDVYTILGATSDHLSALQNELDILKSNK